MPNPKAKTVTLSEKERQGLEKLGSPVFNGATGRRRLKRASERN